MAGTLYVVDIQVKVFGGAITSAEQKKAGKAGPYRAFITHSFTNL